MRPLQKLHSVLSLLLTGLLFNALLKSEEKVWIFFQDKGHKAATKYASSDLGLTPQSLERRARILPPDALIDSYDLPLCSSYLDRLEALGAEIRVTSRWLNGVSAVLTRAQKHEIREWPFVKAVRPVAYSDMVLPESPLPAGPRRMHSSEEHVYNYGTSRTQNEMIRVPDVHDLGITGSRVMIGMLDTGFDYRDRDVFAHLDVVAEYDFIWDDDTTANGMNDPDRQDDHGTETLSVIAGYLPGMLIGPAFQARYALAKTEWLATETRVEEDNWVAGLEWLEAQGVDIVSSSVAYNIFDEGFAYTYDDLDGRTCVTTLAAEIAFQKGVVVVNSAGNERNDPWHYIMSPADGPHVLAAGAVDLTGEITYFSSVGPTADGRYKPDVMAMGMGVVAANPNRDSDYDFFYLSGTSFSCPLVAGVCALVLDAHPELPPIEIRNAVRRTADRASNPDTLYGWGIVNAYEAVFYHGMIFHQFKWLTDIPTGCPVLEVTVRARQGVDPGSVTLYYGESESMRFQETSMELVRDSTRFSARLPSHLDADRLQFYIEAASPDGDRSTGPWDAPAHLYSLSDTTDKSIPLPEESPLVFRLYPAYPNPFNHDTRIEFDLEAAAEVRLHIYNILGQPVRTLISGSLSPGTKRSVWDGRDDRGLPVPSGVYFARLKTPKQSRIVKVSLIR